MEYKQCNHCQELKPLSDFGNNRSMKDGKEPRCKVCRSERYYAHSPHQKRRKIYRDDIHKECGRCGEIKPLAAFCKNKRMRDSRSVWCRDCNATYQAKRKLENPESYQRKLAHERTPRRKAQKNERLRERRREDILFYAQQVASKQRRRARKNKNGGSFTGDEWLDLVKKYNRCCLACNEIKSLVADHVIPICKGGTSYISNIQPLCRSCNACKYTKIIDYRIGR